MSQIKKIILFVLVINCLGLSLIAQNAAEIIIRADNKMRGEESGYSLMQMKIIRPNWERTISFKSWSKGNKYSLVYIISPAREQGQTFLKLDREMWNWNPQIARMTKLPGSMLSQGWMGSDFTNDDLLNQRSIVEDYTHSLLGVQTVSGEACYHLQLNPKPDAPVIWGEIVMWIAKEHDIILKTEYYDEEGYLVKTELATNLKYFEGRYLPSVFELIPAEEEGYKTVVVLQEMKFNLPLDDTFFSQQNMKKIK
ncbi:MAG: outer membrane lipoprotein-sorting protein [Bacteroidota bacterium]|nr:MAG: outer membrane lipoprotein-sorting protein [Bacteroidota bacterium]